MMTDSIRFVIAVFFLSLLSNFKYTTADTSSKLVQIACSRNPTLSFCGGSSSNESTTTVATTTEAETASGDVGEVSRAKVNFDRGTVNTTFLESEELPDLPTFEQHVVRDISENFTVSATPEKLPTKAEVDSLTEAFADSPTDITGSAERAKFLSAEVDTVITDDDDEEIPDDPILDEPLPSKKKNSSNNELGSLLRLPKPRRKKNRNTAVASTTKSPTELVEPPPLPHETAAIAAKDEAPTTVAADQPPKVNVPPGYIEVYITKYCVDHRKDFLVKCRQPKIPPAEVEFCKSYPFNCTSDEDDVVPLLAYCERFLHDYVRVCAPAAKRDRRGRQFCKAYDQFCVPPPTQSDLAESEQALTRCEVIQPEARKVCIPPPPPSDRLNYARCSQFRQFCAKYIDWE
uniref:Domain of unknown function DB domain-containing protein n=1 Tax=Panagrellus redivivus TaxID=6233 RepID=A0A7E4WE16_PANRE